MKRRRKEERRRLLLVGRAALDCAQRLPAFGAQLVDALRQRVAREKDAVLAPLLAELQQTVEVGRFVDEFFADLDRENAVSGERIVIASGPWLKATTLEDLDGWSEAGDEISALTGKVDNLLATWLAHVAPGVRWDPTRAALLARPGFDAYWPDEQDFQTRRVQIVVALARTGPGWKEARLEDLVNLGLELDVARFVASERPTVKGFAG